MDFSHSFPLSSPTTFNAAPNSDDQHSSLKESSLPLPDSTALQSGKRKFSHLEAETQTQTLIKKVARRSINISPVAARLRKRAVSQLIVTPTKNKTRRASKELHPAVPSIVDKGSSDEERIEHHTQQEVVSVFRIAAIYYKKGLVDQGIQFKNTNARRQAGQADQDSGQHAAHDNPFPGLRDNLKETILNMVEEGNLSERALKLLKLKISSPNLIAHLEKLDELSKDIQAKVHRNLVRELKKQWPENSVLCNTALEDYISAATTCIPKECNNKVDTSLVDAVENQMCALFSDCSRPDSTVTPQMVTKDYIDLCSNHLIEMMKAESLLIDRLQKLDALHQKVYTYLNELLENPSLFTYPTTPILAQAPSIFLAIQEIKKLKSEFAASQKEFKGSVKSKLVNFNLYYRVFQGQSKVLLAKISDEQEAFEAIKELLYKKNPTHVTKEKIDEEIANRISYTQKIIHYRSIKLSALIEPDWDLYKSDFSGQERVIWSEQEWLNLTWQQLQSQF